MTNKDALSNVEFETGFEVRQQQLQELVKRFQQAPLDKRDALNDYTPDADDDQRLVIESTAQTIRVVAPAGSGKTQTVINRVLNSVRKGVNPTRFLILTFDNSAVTSLRTKLQERTSELRVDLNELRIATLNAYGYALLREHFGPEHRPVVPADRQRRLVRDIRQALRERSIDRYI